MVHLHKALATPTIIGAMAGLAGELLDVPPRGAGNGVLDPIGVNNSFLKEVAL